MQRIAVVVLTLAFLFLGALALAPAYQDSVQGNPIAGDVTNETTTITADSTIVLDESHKDGVVYGDEPTVYQNGSEITDPTAYDWDETSGTLYIPSDTSLNTSQSIEVSYQWHEPTGAQDSIKDTVSTTIGFGDIIGIVLGAGVLIAALAVAGRT